MADLTPVLLDTINMESKNDLTKFSKNIMNDQYNYHVENQFVTTAILAVAERKDQGDIKITYRVSYSNCSNPGAVKTFKKCDGYIPEYSRLKSLLRELKTEVTRLLYNGVSDQWSIQDRVLDLVDRSRSGVQHA